MSINLQYQSVYAAEASQNTTLTVLGEDGLSIVPDETIVSEVSLAALKNALKYSPGWAFPADGKIAPDTDLPDVTWDPSALVAAMKESSGETVEDKFVKKYTTGTAPTFEDDSLPSGATCDSIQKLLYNLMPASASIIDEIPFEAITKVAVSTPLVDSLASKLVASAATDNQASPQFNLFEAAIAAGRAPVEGSADDRAGQLALQAGDSFSVFVRYALSKSRTVEIDSVQGVASGDAGASAGVSAAKFRFPNGDLLVAGSNDSDEATGTHLVEWKFVAA
jgi:hypothetical protein